MAGKGGVCPAISGERRPGPGVGCWICDTPRKKSAMPPIDALRGASLAPTVSGLASPFAPKGAGATGFADLVKAALDQASQAQNDAGKLQERFQLEDPEVGLEETMIAMQKASLGFQAVVQARNKLVSAYTDIMNMSV